MKTARVICNVGYFRGFGESTYFNAFLAKLSNGEEVIVLRKPAETIDGVAYLATFVWIKKESLGAASGNTHNIPTSIINRLAVNIELSVADETEFANRFKPAVFSVETVLLALTANAYNLAGIANVPAPFTVKGINTSDAEVTALKDVLGVDEPVNTGGTSGNAIIPVSTIVALPELQKDPIGAAQAAFSNPLDYAKANPISAAVMVVGIAELGSLAGLWKFSPLKAVGLRKGGRR